MRPRTTRLCESVLDTYSTTVLFIVVWLMSAERRFTRLGQPVSRLHFTHSWAPWPWPRRLTRRVRDVGASSGGSGGSGEHNARPRGSPTGRADGVTWSGQSAVLRCRASATYRSVCASSNDDLRSVFPQRPCADYVAQCLSPGGQARSKLFLSMLDFDWCFTLSGFLAFCCEPISVRL